LEIFPSSIGNVSCIENAFGTVYGAHANAALAENFLRWTCCPIPGLLKPRPYWEYPEPLINCQCKTNRENILHLSPGLHGTKCQLVSNIILKICQLYCIFTLKVFLKLFFTRAVTPHMLRFCFYMI
jgi:hypothetical protein